jgi:hypothetical protein
LLPLRLRTEEKITALARRISSRGIAFSPDNTTGLSTAAPAPTYLLPRQPKMFRAVKDAGGAKAKKINESRSCEIQRPI